MSDCPFANIMAPTYLGDGFEGADVASNRLVVLESAVYEAGLGGPRSRGHEP
jgi:hypothetical protein